MVNDARADGGRCPRCGARCGCGGVAVLATHRCARGARHSLARPPRLCALSARLPPLAQMAARSGRKRLRARRGGFAAPPPVAACVRRSRAAAAVGRSAARSPLKRGLMWLVSPRSLPAAAPAPASVCAASSGGGACSPLWAAAPPPLLRPRPPLSVGGGGCGFHVSAAAGLRPLRRARKRPPLVGRSWRKHNIWRLPYLTAVFLLSHLVTQSAQEMSPVMFRQVRPMSNRRSTP